jgi:hypothetical protein
MPIDPVRLNLIRNRFPAFLLTSRLLSKAVCSSPQKTVPKSLSPNSRAASSVGETAPLIPERRFPTFNK